MFNDSKRFPILYNNLKGWIAEIEKTKKEIQFTIDIDLMLTEKECKENGIEYIGENGKYTRICFSVFKYDINVPDDKEDKIDTWRFLYGNYACKKETENILECGNDAEYC